MTENEGAGIAAIAARLGWESVPEILEANEVAVRRGHHLALVATEGSGVEALYAFAALQAAESAADADDNDVLTLVLCPTDERSGRVARALRAAIGPDGAPVFLAAGGWTESRGIPAGTRIVVSRPSRILPAIRSGHFATGSVKLLVLDEAASLKHLDEWSSVEPILDTLGSDARKIAATGRPDTAFRQLLERQLPRGRRWPEELLPIAGAEEESGDAGDSGLPVQVAVGPISERLALLEACVSAAEDAGDTISVVCADPGEALEASAALAVAGRKATLLGDEISLLPVEPETGSTARILLGAPLGLAEFRAALDGFAQRFVIVEPARLAHVETLARRAGMPVTQFGGPPPADPLDAVVIYRRQLEDALRATDFVPELLVLEPLIDRYGGARVAAALSALLRRGDDSSQVVVPWPDIEAASFGGGAGGGVRTQDTASRAERRPARGSRAERGPSATPRGARSAWTKLYFGIGRKDDIKPGDLVGAITGETGIVGGQIGKIEIRGGFSLVEIDSQVVDDVLRKLQGVTIRGQEVPVRPDRER